MSDRGRGAPAPTTGPAGSVTGARSRLRLTAFDALALMNVALWASMAWFVHRRRLATFRGEASLAEFFLYATLTAVALALVWATLRRFSWHPALLAMAEVALLMCFAGGVVFAGGRRLYDCVWLSIRFDKLVHFSSAFVGAFVVGALFHAYRVRPRRLEAAVVVLVVLGAGAIWEIIEYFVVTTFPDAGVGAYDNNMQDLVANLVGGLASRLVPVRWRRTLEQASDAAMAAPRQVEAPSIASRPAETPRAISK